MSSIVIYSSATGNTEQVAKEIFRAIPDSDKDMRNIEGFDHKADADVYFIGFWNNRGSCAMEIIDLLSSLHGKKVALFGTCGMGNAPEYYHSVEQKISVWLPDDNQYLGTFLCQGKMQMNVRNRYEAMRTEENSAKVDLMIHNFDEAMLHPDDTDFANARSFVKGCYEQV